MGIGRTHAAAAVAAVVVLIGIVLAVAITRDAGDPPSGERSSDAPALPEVVNAPGTWSDDEDLDGPLAALGLSVRTSPQGLTGARQRLETFGVSAVDGHAAWIDLPGIELETEGLVGRFAVSPDGRWIGWSRHREGRRAADGAPLVGWAVMDTTTGAVRELADPTAGRVRDTLADLAFTGDSRYLLTSYEKQGAPTRRGHQLVAWDVRDGDPTIVEEPGTRSLANVGSAPADVVWARGRTVHRYDVVQRERSALTVPHEVITASWGPDDRAFAYVGAPERSNGASRLYAGPTLEEARERTIALPSEVEASQILGWADEQHVVVGRFRTTVYVVDVLSGEVVERAMGGSGEQLNVPLLAADLWQRPLVPAVTPDGTTDPRRPWWWISAALLLAGAVFLVVRRRRPARGALPSPAPDVHVPLASSGPVTSLRPLGTAATGLLVVLVDVRIQGFDLVPDPLGWVLAAVALSSLQRVHRGFHVAGIAAWLAVLPALPEWLGVQGSLITFAISVAVVVVEVAVCTAVLVVRPARERSASAIRWLTLGLNATLLLAILAASAEPAVGVLAFTAGLASLLVTVWFVVMMYGVAREAPREDVRLAAG